MFLDAEELIELTGRRRRNSQIRALREMGIEHKIRPDGSVVVLTQHVIEQFGVKTKQESRPRTEPNWKKFKEGLNAQ
jgi:hypothetical protein